MSENTQTELTGEMLDSAMQTDEWVQRFARPMIDDSMTAEASVWQYDTEGKCGCAGSVTTREGLAPSLKCQHGNHCHLWRLSAELRDSRRGIEVRATLAQQAWHHVGEIAIVNPDMPVQQAVQEVYRRCTEPRVITRVMDDGIKTKDGCA